MSGFASSPLWYATRSTGIVSFLLLTLVMVLGVAATQRSLASPRWPRFATQTLHRNASLLALALLAVHIVTTIVDSYVDIGWWSAVLPLSSSYDRLGVALGTLTLDLAIVLVASSLLRTHISVALWRRIHLAAYAAWPLALAHFLLTGTDSAHGRWGLWLGLLTVLPVLAATAVRLWPRQAPVGPVRSVSTSTSTSTSYRTTSAR